MVENEARQRRISLEELGRKLTIPLIRERAEHIQRTQMRGINSRLRASFEILGFTLKKPANQSSRASYRGRCAFCVGSDNKYTTKCDECERIFCPEHGDKLQTSICQGCIL